MKAKKLLIGYLEATHRIAEDYNKKARFAQFEGDQKEFEWNMGQYKDYQEKINELKEAIQEIESLEVAA